MNLLSPEKDYLECQIRNALFKRNEKQYIFYMAYFYIVFDNLRKKPACTNLKGKNLCMN